MSKMLARNGALPYSVSQNFLTSKKLIERLVKRAAFSRADHVLEIGAGKGHITKALLEAGVRVDAYEIDAGLHARLHRQLQHARNLRLYRQDFLKAALPKAAPYKVFSNIPFSRTTAILQKLITAQNPPQEAWLIMEKGAARRFLGQPVETQASLQLKPFFNAKIVHQFSRQDFHPSPSVDVVMLRLSRKQQPDIAKRQQRAYRAFIQRACQYGIDSMLTKRQVSAALKCANLPPIRESGVILYVQWLCLFRWYSQLRSGKT